MKCLKLHFLDKKFKFEVFPLGFSFGKVNSSILGNLELLRPSLALREQTFKVFRNFEKICLCLDMLIYYALFKNLIVFLIISHINKFVNTFIHLLYKFNINLMFNIISKCEEIEGSL